MRGDTKDSLHGILTFDVCTRIFGASGECDEICFMLKILITVVFCNLEFVVVDLVILHNC